MKGAKVAVIGAGAWGTALAKVIAEKGCPTVVWCRRQEQADEINYKHTNSRYLKDIKLPENLSASSDIEEVADGKSFIILAVPSLYLLNEVKHILNVSSIREGDAAIGVITKGFLESPFGPRLILDVLEDYLPGFYRGRLVYISGPSHAEEVAQGKITGLIAASCNARESIRFRYLLKTQTLLVFSSLDARGVQVSAAVKNVIAIAFGVLDAFKTQKSRNSERSPGELFGDNAGSLLLAAGLSEIQTLGLAMGATHPETFTSIAGVGDLDVTCRSIYGRNHRFGREIVEKKILDPFKNIDDLIERIDEIGYMPEGIAACNYVNCLQKKYNLRLPICEQVYHVLNKDIDTDEAMKSTISKLG
ncbi:MAG: NAD(P)-dependent glycerol-3-phosphate dehydrogenase [Spirochaetaceae bacterium]|jgi:glycerol-3-phosphate dehydrogenase (NAD(P)+)|nr:NAD(P)-dependent glycerol-3-phosphate dehydrogenase [Spirochaetaceae bacterium]